MTNEPKVYIIFLHGQPPQRIFSTVDILRVWIDACADRAKRNAWHEPVLFYDDEDLSHLVGAYFAYAIQGIVCGVIVPENKLSEVAYAAAESRKKGG